MSFLRMTDLDLAGQRVLIREDLNAPLKDGRITSEGRLRAALETIAAAREAGARVMVMSHLDRPAEGRIDPAWSLAPIADRLGELTGEPVPLVQDWLEGVEAAPGEVVLLENVRFNTGEAADDDGLARRMAALCDVFVMDAFATAHRAQASTHGVARHAPSACAGPLFAREVDALRAALQRPERPMVAIVGGSKVSDKLTVLDELSSVVDRLIPGGGIANTFLVAAGYDVGESLYERELVGEAQQLLRAARERGSDIPLPEDVVVAEDVSGEAEARICSVTEVAPHERIVDIGPRTAERFGTLLDGAGTILWNGPVGVFEIERFGEGTRALAKAIAASPAFSVAGGGDTLAAIDRYGVAGGISCISTGGGAFLEFIEGHSLPAIAVLEARAGG